MGAGPLTGKSDGVDATSVVYDEMLSKWELINDLLGGTAVMRARGEKWLPKETREQDAQYRNRVQRSFLFNGLRDTIEKLVAKPFSREVNVVGDDDEHIADLREKVDRQGTNLTTFASSAFTSAVKYGLVHILVDFPPTTATVDGAQAPSVADEREQDLRPFFVQVDAPRLLSWVTSLVNGKRRLERVRIRETRVEATGDAGDEAIEYIREVSRTDWTLWRFEKDENTFIKHSSGLHTFGEVPLVTVYIDQRKGYFSADPPLEDLAWLNIAHWQSSSDQRNILRFARVGILFGKGFEEEEVQTLTIGPNTFLKSTNPEADLKYVEHQGTAINAGKQDIDDLEAKMELLGLQPMIATRSGTQTATGKAIDEGRTESAIQAWIRRVENGLVQCYEYAAQWVNKELPDDFSVDVYNDFGVTIRGTSDQTILKDLRAQGDITQETLLREMKRRGTLSEALDVESEIEQTQEEALIRVRDAAAAIEELDEPEEGEEESEEDDASVSK